MECAKSAAVHLVMFIAHLARAVFVGLASLFLALWRLSSRWVGNYPSIALGGFLVAFFLIWLLTFVSMRERAVSAEDRYSAIVYEYKLFREQHGYE